MSDQTDDQFSDEEAAQRRDTVVKRMLATPPKPKRHAKGRSTSRSKSNHEVTPTKDAVEWARLSRYEPDFLGPLRE
jgi:hypothetical protein